MSAMDNLITNLMTAAALAEARDGDNDDDLDRDFRYAVTLWNDAQRALERSRTVAPEHRRFYVNHADALVDAANSHAHLFTWRMARRAAVR